MKNYLILTTILVLMSLIYPTASLAQAPECESEYVVQAGDFLSQIAEQSFNDPLAFPALMVLANAVPDDKYDNIDDPGVIEEGWTICIPSEEDLPDLLAEADPAIQAIARQAGFDVPPPLEETLWVLVGYGDPAEPTVVEAGTVVAAQFGEDGTLTGSGGCNSYNSTYELGPGDSISIDTVASTRAFCADGMEQEQAYLAALENATTFQITPDGFLQIEYSTGLQSSETLFFVPGQANLQNTQWVLQAFGDPDELQSVEAATTVTAVFTVQTDSNKGTIVGYGGCNTYAADYLVQDNRIIVQPATSTRAICPAGSEQETAYLALLGEADLFQIVGRRLLLTGPNGVLVFSSANLPLEQVLWTLESFGDPGGQQPFIGETEITALFVANDEGTGGKVSGSAGCNTYNAGYEKERRQLTFGPAITTLMACESGLEAEQAFLAALETVERYQTLGDQLRLFYDDGQQVITFRADRTLLQETYWVLNGYGDIENPRIPVTDVPVSAVFERHPAAPSGVMAGSTGCNNYSATYAASLTQIRVNPPLNTMAFCGGAVGDVERAYLQGLASAENYSIVGNVLQVVYDGGEQALNFVASQPPMDIPAPTAVIQGPTQAQVGDTVVFSGSSSQSEVPIVQYSWNFGDGVSAAGETVTYIYGQPGTYIVTLTVVDERGISSSTTSSITITPAPTTGPTAVIEGPSQALVGQDVTFQGGNSIAGDSPIVVYAWSVGGPVATASSADVSFTTRFDEPGQYEVTLTVTDQNGLSDSAGLTITIIPRNEPQVGPTAVIEGPSQAAVGEQVTFRGGNSIPGSSPIVLYAWNIGDPQARAVSNDVSFTTSFDQPGVYLITLAVTDQNGLSDSASLQIEITEAEVPETGPTAVIEGPSQAVVGEAVTFQGGNSIAGSSPIVVYAWSIDGPQATSASTDVSFTTSFDQAGVYNVTLTVTDQNGLSDSSSLPVEVTAAEVPETPPTAVIEGPSEAFVGDPVTFQGGNSAAGSSPITGYAWDFGNGQIANEAVGSTVYDAPGTYQASLTVTDENGLSNTTSTAINISPRLEGIVWVLDNTLPDTTITAQFGGGTVSGSAGCNNYNGTVITTQAAGPSNAISISDITTTQQACEEPVMNQEQTYLSALASAQSYGISGNTLTISFTGGTLTYLAQ